MNSMSDRFFVDTNILMYAHDTSAGEKHERAKAVVEELWRDRTGVGSTQVLQEFAVTAQTHEHAHYPELGDISRSHDGKIVGPDVGRRGRLTFSGFVER